MLAVMCAVALGAVFLAAGVLKLATPARWIDQARGLGVPPAVAHPVPVVELVVGALLVTQWRRAAVAWVALGVLVAFTALLVRRLAQGRRPPCACFGSLTARPIGWGSVARNGVLAALAAVVIAA